MENLTERQQEYVTNLRNIADFFELNPDLIHYWQPLSVYISESSIEDATERIKGTHRVWKKGTSGYDYELTTSFGPHSIRVYVPRDQVCEKIQVGEEVKKVPDPDYEVPMVEKVVPVYEWVCPPSILALTDQPEETEETENVQA